MKYLIVLFVALSSFCSAQTVALSKVDSVYVVTEVTETDNGTDVPDITETSILIGGLQEARGYIRRERRRARARYNALSAMIFNERYEAKDRMFLRLADSLAWNLDSVMTAQLLRRVFPDTFTVVLQVDAISAADKLDYMTDTTATGTVDLTIVIGQNNNGRFRFESVYTSGKWPLTINSETDFDLIGWLGSKHNFFRIRENRRRDVFIDRTSATDAGVETRIILQK